MTAGQTGDRGRAQSYDAGMTAPQDPFTPPPAGGPASYGQQPYGGPAPGSPAGSYGPPPGWGSPAPAPWQAPRRTETKAVIALGLAIAAWTPLIPFIGAIAALVLARMARRDIQASGGALEGLGLCTWATVLSVVHLVVVSLFFVVVLGLFAVPFAFSL